MARTEALRIARCEQNVWRRICGPLFLNRKRLGISQEELAHRANLPWTYVSDLERGLQSPTIDVVNRLTRGLGVSLAEFFAPFDQPYRVRIATDRQTHSTEQVPVPFSVIE